MSKRKAGNVIIKIVSLVILLALLIGGAVFLYRYTNGFNEDLKTFYLEYQGEKILSDSKEMRFLYGKEQKFDVKYTFDLEQGERDYSVKIVPNEDVSFNYSVDGIPKKWRAANETADLSAYFNLKKEETSFTFTVPDGLTVAGLLGKIYPEGTVTVDGDALKGKPLYRLVVSSYNGEITYSINFSAVAVEVTLDREYIIFGE